MSLMDPPSLTSNGSLHKGPRSFSSRIKDLVPVEVYLYSKRLCGQMNVCAKSLTPCRFLNAKTAHPSDSRRDGYIQGDSEPFHACSFYSSDSDQQYVLSSICNISSSSSKSQQSTTHNNTLGWLLNGCPDSALLSGSLCTKRTGNLMQKLHDVVMLNQRADLDQRFNCLPQRACGLVSQLSRLTTTVKFRVESLHTIDCENNEFHQSSATCVDIENAIYSGSLFPEMLASIMLHHIQCSSLAKNLELQILPPFAHTKVEKASSICLQLLMSESKPCAIGVSEACNDSISCHTTISGIGAKKIKFLCKRKNSLRIRRCHSKKRCQTSSVHAIVTKASFEVTSQKPASACASQLNSFFSLFVQPSELSYDSSDGDCSDDSHVDQDFDSFWCTDHWATHDDDNDFQENDDQGILFLNEDVAAFCATSIAMHKTVSCRENAEDICNPYSRDVSKDAVEDEEEDEVDGVFIPSVSPLHEVNRRWSSFYHPPSEFCCEQSRQPKHCKVVHFSDETSFVTVLNCIEWAEYYAEARRGLWVQDRMRFDQRIKETEKQVGWVLSPQHRAKLRASLFDN